jgi:hypothetical protein
VDNFVIWGIDNLYASAQDTYMETTNASYANRYIRKCSHCGSTSYRGTYQAHLAASHPKFATPMRPWSDRVARMTGR